MRNFLIKLLGGFTKDEVLAKNSSRDNEVFLELGLIENELAALGQKVSMARAVGIRYTLNERTAPIVVNLSSANGLRFFKNSHFEDICKSVLNLSAISGQAYGNIENGDKQKILG